ncbi:alpha/beta fold hydrolase [Yaniella halotolerans]|uniref:alpha/beta fold hydrolase n=1 Tax=Yaniella halotolerans TaxID=225453 RepID=UPI0003B3CDF1|nr:alpha/beta hydrolase [Yaniella halotolerans]
MEDTVTTNLGDTISFDIEGSGPPLIFLAGAGPFREIDPATTQTAQRAADFGLTTVVYDRIGRGKSFGSEPITLDREVAALARLVDFVGGTAAVCGHSSGSAIALCAAVSGVAINRLALWEVPFFGTPEHTRRWADDSISMLETGDNVHAVELFTRDMPEDFRDGLRDSPIWEELITHAQSLRPDAEALAWFDAEPLTQRLGDLTIPIHAMVGGSTFDEMHMAADAIEIAVDSATKEVMPGADHNWEVEPMARTLARWVANG